MKSRKMINFFVLTVAVSTVLVACASRPTLEPRSAAVPPGADLSGAWQLQLDPAAKRMPGEEVDLRIRIPPEISQRSTTRRSTKRSTGTAVHVFLETGESLKITQTEEGLFISFDRAVVEEYTFGENRIVSVGPIKAQRVSGWEEQLFVVETLDEQGTILTETWHIDTLGDVLVRDIRVSRGTAEQFSTRQRFDRS